MSYREFLVMMKAAHSSILSAACFEGNMSNKMKKYLIATNEDFRRGRKEVRRNPCGRLAHTHSTTPSAIIEKIRFITFL